METSLPTKGWARSTYIPPSPDPTCGITLGMLLLHICGMVKEMDTLIGCHMLKAWNSSHVNMTFFICIMHDEEDKMAILEVLVTM